ncbi:MAG: hypothetical protein EU541_06875 [Promethearchaeota archaeon]|nr:MAG: hypothetical protein EU541_06875 [Candidatus Lokiarchaeota archaeon]
MKSKPKINIDENRCSQPDKCRKCLQVCQPCVLNLTFIDEDYHKPKNWKIIPAFPQLCLGPECGKCEEVCPKGAIGIEYKSY